MMDELLDIVSDDDVVMDQQMRSTVHQLGLLHRGVHVFLFTSDGKMLVQKRSADRAAEPSALDCSISEHVKAGESYRDAAVRGLREEMGLWDVSMKPLARFKMKYGPNDNEISTLYEGVVDPSRVIFDREEIEEINYYTIDEIHEMMKNTNVKFCGWFVEILNWYMKKPAILQILPL
jgi:isopentenyl-diphosphate delta-isomerase